MAVSARVKIVWNRQKVWQIVEGAPPAAHAQAALVAAAAAAAMINSKKTGKLANDVRQPKPVGPMSSNIGSGLVYARIQHFGGTIAPGKLMAIHDAYRYPAGARNVSTGEGVGGRFAPKSVIAFAWRVTIPAKRYLDAAGPAYIAALPARYAALFPA